MKKNLVLFGVFVALLVATYFMQEKRIETERTEEHLAGLLVKTDITQLKLPNVEAEKKNGQWWSGKKLLSHNTFKQIEKKLSEIKKEKEVTGDPKSYFPHPISFELNHEKWQIGDMSLDKQSFYISRGDKIYLAYIEGESTHLTRNASEIESIKLNELVSLISKKPSDYFETQLFRFYPSIPMDKVLMTVEGHLPFELNFVSNETLPPPIKGVSPHRDLRGKFYSLLTQINMKEEIPYSEKLKFKKIGEVNFVNDKNSVKWELWLKNDKSADAYIIDPNSKRAFLMVGGTLRIFFVGIQDYWDKKVIPYDKFVSFTRLETNFVQGSKSARVTIVNKEPFEFAAKGYTVDNLKMEELLQIIFNLGPKDQADRVSNLSSSEKKQLMTESHLRVEIMDQDLVIWRKAQEVIVANLTQGFKAHFNMLNENFRGTFDDVLK
jgi:hypothetical protein